MAAVCLPMASCDDLDSLNEDPNNPSTVFSNMMMEGAEKWTMDNIYNSTFSARQCLLFSQQWAQVNYTETDRYKIQETTNDNHFDYLYMGMAYFDKVIKMNTDEASRHLSAAYGANCNQIAAAKIMKVWLMDIITDTWGSVPYSDISKLEDEGVIYCKYDDQKDIYTQMIKELDEAVSMIDVEQKAFTSGDIIFNGDASKWKKFGNSLKCRLAIHLSKVDPDWKKYIAEAVASGVMESNADAAKFAYASSGSDYCMFYSSFFVDGRNDFTINRNLSNLMNGKRDTLNNKQHPWEGTVDPRIYVYTNATPQGTYDGIPYACPTGTEDMFRSAAPNWYTGQPLVVTKTYAVPLMTYAELKFILCEYNGYDVENYKEGIKASIDYWYGLAGRFVSVRAVNDYVKAVSKNVNAEACAIQKYIDLYTNGTEAWTEIRRTGYPDQLLRPSEITAVYNGNNVLFTPLSDTKGMIIPRVKYPTEESTLNGTNWKEAVAKLKDGTNNYYSQMYWDVRTSPYDHPANK